MPHLLPKHARTALLSNLKKLIETPPADTPGNLAHVVKHILGKKKMLRHIAERHGTPCYVLDGKELDTNIASFSKACSTHIPRTAFFYAVKTNPHPFILRRVLGAGFGLDVASVTEIDCGLRVGAKRFVFSGPGKTNAQLQGALRHTSMLTLNIDSFDELDRLGAIINKTQKRIRCGVRIHTDAHGDWQKFGIALHDLAPFIRRSKRYPGIALEGIQFHTSLNENAEPYVQTLRRIAHYLKKDISKKDLSALTFIDMGGGFYPYRTDGYHPWVIPAGQIAKIVSEQAHARVPFLHPYYRIDAVPVEDYAREIGAAIKKYLEPLLECAYYIEPGRIISSTAMHILLRVVDIKSQRCAIMDGGNNMVGWERLSYDYFPVINLTHPGMKEHACILYGSLCLSGNYDTWGYYYYGSRLARGDIMVVPYQGHLTYALAQNFIHPIPPVHIIS